MPLRKLRLQSSLVAVCGGLALLVAGRELAAGWIVGAGVSWLYCVTSLFRWLSRNRGAVHAPLAPNLGWPTGVTLVRAWLIAFMAGFVFVTEIPVAMMWLAAMAYTLAALLDHVDGRLARRLDRTTLLGAHLDMEVDALGILAASLLAVQSGKLPGWYLAIGLARYLFVAGVWWRERSSQPVASLSPNRARRLLAGFQMGFLCAALWPLVPARASLLAAFIFGVPTLAMFLRDWLVVSRRLEPATTRFQNVASSLESAHPTVAQLARYALVAIVGSLLLRQAMQGWPDWTASIFGGAAGMGALVVCTRFSRFGAAMATVALTLALRDSRFDALWEAALVCSLAVLVLGRAMSTRSDAPAGEVIGA